MAAAGQLGQADLSAGVDTALYAPPASTKASIFVNMANRNATPIAVRVILRPSTGPTGDADYLTFDEAIPANQSRSSRIFDIENPQELLVRSDLGSVTAQANGIERAV